METAFQIAVIPGDGIGPEVLREAVRVLRRAVSVAGGFSVELREYPAGAETYRETGRALPESTIEGARTADAILLGACGLPDVRYPDGTEIIPQVELRTILDLYAGIRPIRGFPGIPPVLAQYPPEAIDLVVVRESTEGLFASRGAGIVLGDSVATDTQVITRAGTERVIRAAFEWCRDRPRRHDQARRVTCVDKANVLRSFAFFRRVFDEIAVERRDPPIESDHCYVDAMALRLVRDPASLDVLVMENMFGDILSDLAAGLVGGLGMAPSADIGDRHAVFQPVPGTAPDIAGRGIANPIAAILSAALLLDWLGASRSCPPARAAAARVEAAVRAVLAHGMLPPDLGGTATTGEIGDAVEEQVMSDE